MVIVYDKVKSQNSETFSEHTPIFVKIGNITGLNTGGWEFRISGNDSLNRFLDQDIEVKSLLFSVGESGNYSIVVSNGEVRGLLYLPGNEPLLSVPSNGVYFEEMYFLPVAATVTPVATATQSLVFKPSAEMSSSLARGFNPTNELDRTREVNPTIELISGNKLSPTIGFNPSSKFWESNTKETALSGVTHQRTTPHETTINSNVNAVNLVPIVAGSVAGIIVVIVIVMIVVLRIRRSHKSAESSNIVETGLNSEL